MIEEIKIDRLEELIHEMMIKIRNTSVTNSAEGNPIEIENAAAAPLVRCVSAITGSQDLNGYDKPWAAGTGKNKANFTEDTSLPMSNSSATIFHLEDNMEEGQRLIISFFFKNAVYASNSGALLNIRDKDGTTHYYTAPSFGMTPNTPLTGIYSLVVESAPAFNDVLVYLGAYYGQFSAGTASVMLQIGDDVQIPTSYEPYANICKITAFSTGSVEVEDEDEQSTTYTATFSDPIYQGSIDYVAKKTTATWGYIASYDGESLPGRWISDRDEYSPGTTPTTGAEVAYELASAAVETVNVSNAPVSAVHGYNKIESSTGEMEVTYITEDFEPLVPAA